MLREGSQRAHCNIIFSFSSICSNCCIYLENERPLISDFFFLDFVLKDKQDAWIYKKTCFEFFEFI